MKPALHLAAALAAIACAATLATDAQAASSAVASASDSVITSVGSISRSFRQSSDSSSRTTVGQGLYEVIQVAEAEPGMHELTLEALPGQPQAQGRFTLRLPTQALQQAALAPGQRVAAREKPYGWEFARADTQVAFFLLLADDWYRELASVPLGS